MSNVKNRTVVLGRGFLGKEFERQGFNVWGRDKLDCDSRMNVIDKLSRFDFVVNCIAKSNTRWCEDRNNFFEALEVNGYFPRMISSYCNMEKIKFVHISTGCLYDDSIPFQKETNPIVAHCSYTVTKWMGEMGCNPNRDLILRPRLLFSNIPDRNNLLCKIPKFEKFVADAVDSLTHTKTVVEATEALLENNQAGIFNVAQDGYASIREIAKWCGLNAKPMSARELRERETLYLVNNTMELDKLKQFYSPKPLREAIEEAWGELQHCECK